VHRPLLEQQEHGGAYVPALGAHAVAATVVARTTGHVAERTTAATPCLAFAVAKMLFEMSAVVHQVSLGCAYDNSNDTSLLFIPQAA
jgi:hypothetical protein